MDKGIRAQKYRAVGFYPQECLTVPGVDLYHTPLSRLRIPQADKGVGLEGFITGVGHGRYPPTLFPMVSNDTPGVGDIPGVSDVMSITSMGDSEPVLALSPRRVRPKAVPKTCEDGLARYDKKLPSAYVCLDVSCFHCLDSLFYDFLLSHYSTAR